MLPEARRCFPDQCIEPKGTNFVRGVQWKDANRSKGGHPITAPLVMVAMAWPRPESNVGWPLDP